MSWPRVVMVWLALMVAEIIHGLFRGVLLTPRVGDQRARQMGVFTGSLLNLGIAWLAIDWIGQGTRRALAGAGLLWVALTVVFELAFGRLVARLSWQRLRSDYDPREGGLLPLGLAALAASPLLADHLRRTSRRQCDLLHGGGYSGLT